MPINTYKTTKISTIFVSLCILVCSFFFGIVTHSLTSAFEKGVVLDDLDFYGVPESMWSPGNNKDEVISEIQNFLEINNSFLADYKPLVSFEEDTSFLNQSIYQYPSTSEYNPNILLKDYIGKNVSVAEIIYILSVSDIGGVCSTYSPYVSQNEGLPFCVDRKINPYFILALIQKESGMIKGSNANLDPNNSSDKWLIDRAVGYKCSEGARTDSCYDVNPNWKYYQGFFRQLYWGVRWMKVVTHACNTGVDPDADIGEYRVINSQNVKIETAFACAHYWYTPHIQGSELLYIIYKDLLGDEKLIVNELVEDYQPAPVKSTPVQSPSFDPLPVILG